MIRPVLLAASLLLSSIASPVLLAAESAASAAPTAVAEQSQAQVNINTADMATLARELSGIGEVKARAIVEYRDAQGPFDQVDDLLEVQGIGTGLLERNRQRIRVN